MDKTLCTILNRIDSKNNVGLVGDKKQISNPIMERVSKENRGKLVSIKKSLKIVCPSCSYENNQHEFKVINSVLESFGTYYTEYECPKCYEKILVDKQETKNVKFVNKYLIYKSFNSKEEVIDFLNKALKELK